MELEDFRRDLIESARARADTNFDFNRSSFMEEVGERLADAEEIVDVIACQYERQIGKCKLAIDGYTFDEADNSFSLLIANFSNDDTTPTFNTLHVTRAFALLRSFIDEALHGRLTDGSIEESHPAYGLASELSERHGMLSKYRLYFVSDGLLKSKTKDWVAEDIGGVSAELHIWDIARFHAAYMSSTGRDELCVDFSEFGGCGLPFLAAEQSEGDYQAYLCMIPGKVLAGIYDRHGSRLLEGNVRSFLSTRAKVNAKIQVTIRTKPEMFFAFNNGIAATAEGVSISDTSDGKRIASAINFQIVNGGQTTASIAYAGRGTSGKNDGADLSKVMVQMKLSVLPPENAGVLIPEIARYANSQTKVSDADFFANHPFHIRMEEFSRRLFTPPANGLQYGTHWFYERARGQYVNEQAKFSSAQKRQFGLQNPKSQLLVKTDLAKFENSWRGLPHKVSLGAQKNFILFAETISKAWAGNDSEFNEDYFRNLIALALIFRRTETLIKQQSWYQGGYRANVVTYTIAKLNCMIAEQAIGSKLDLRQIWDKQTVPIVVIEQITIIAKRVFEILTDPRRPKDNVTEWAKLQACWDQVKAAEIELNEAMEVALTDAINLRQAAKDAKIIQKTDNGIAIQMSVVGIPGTEWQRMRTWGIDKGVLTTAQIDLLRLASLIPSRLPSEKQSAQIWQIRANLIADGYLI